MPEKSIYTETFKAAADLSTYQNCFVKLTAANTVNVCGSKEKILGVLKNAPAVIGYAAEVQILGIAEVKCNGNAPNMVVGDWVICGASGVAVSGAVAKDPVAGQANTAATADGVLIEVLLTGPFALAV